MNPGSEPSKGMSTPKVNVRGHVLRQLRIRTADHGTDPALTNQFLRFPSRRLVSVLNEKEMTSFKNKYKSIAGVYNSLPTPTLL